MKNQTRLKKWTLLLGILGVSINPVYASPAFTDPVKASPQMYEVPAFDYQVPLHKSRVIHFSNRILSISQSDHNIAKVDKFPNDRVILIKGLALGTTNINVLYQNGEVQVINVEVSHDLDSLKTKLNELLPGENIEVRSSQSNIVLSGQVSAVDKMQQAIDVARGFLPLGNSQGGGAGGGSSPAASGGGEGAEAMPPLSNTSISIGGQQNSQKDPHKNNGPEVINMMSVSGAHQVMLEVKVAEIDRRLAKNLNIQFNAFRPSNGVGFGALNGGGTFTPIVSPIGLDSKFTAGAQTDIQRLIQLLSGDRGGLVGPIRSVLNQTPHSIDAAGLFLSAISGDFIFNLTVDAAKDQDLAKILAEPTLTTLSGQEARFISGGEFPIPVPQSTGLGIGMITIKFKEFGVSLRFLPLVLDTGRINLNMNVSVSELSQDAAIATDIAGSDLKFTIPSLTKREASSTLELADGQTMSIAGLISDSVRENVNKFPGLGDVPVLGALFRNERFLKNQTELVIFVTPRLAKPVLASSMVLPTDSFVEPDDLDFYVFGKMEARNAHKRVKLKNLTAPKASQGGLDGQFGHQLNEGK